MSDRFGLKVKENAGKTKYSSLNLNQTYKGTKVETKTSSGTARHGLQSLGKVGASRRIPPPANLPSLKSENSGNDPTVSLVPSGGGGWGSAKEKPSETPPATTSQTVPPSSTPSQTNVPTSQPPLLQPQRPIPPPSHPQHVQQPQPQSQNSGQTQTQPAKQQQESPGKTWGIVSSNEGGGQGKSYSHQEMPYFNREFPVLGGGNSGERLPPHMEGKDPPHAQHGQRPIMRNMHEPAWMERSGPGPPPSDYGPARERTDVYNGGPVPGYGGGHQYKRPPDYQHGTQGKNIAHSYPSYSYGNGPQGHGPGRHSHGYPPDHHSRGPGNRPGGPGPLHVSKIPDMGRGEGYGRPAILKPEDIQAMADNDEEEEGGWAGAQDEVDYAAKLDFEDFDDDEKPSMEASTRPEKRSTSGEPETRWQSNEGRTGKEMGPPPARSAWTESSGQPHPYSENRQVPQGPSVRPFESRGSPPTPGWPMPYPQQLSVQQRGGQPVQPPSPVSSDQGQPGTKSEEPVVNEWQKRRVKQQEEMRAAVERARKRREEEELRRQAEQKAAATAKLKELELKRVRRESAKEGDDAWAEELDSIEKDACSKEASNEQGMSESPRRDSEPQNLAVNQQDGALIRNELPEHVNRQRNDSESSDASRSSASRGSRPHHHTPRDIPPRFQQQQLRQQQQQHFQQQQHYQQQQPYPQQYPYHQQQQLARSPQLREFPEGPLSVASHYPMPDSGPVSPSQPFKPEQPVRRIMKRSDSSSTAGDDIASVKSLESGSGEASREGEKRTPSGAFDKPVKADINEEQAKESSVESSRPSNNVVERKPDDQDIPVFDETKSFKSGDTRQRKQSDSDKPRLSESNKENVASKERVHEKRERKESLDGISKPIPEKRDQARDRREDRRSSKRDTRPQDNRRSEDFKDLGKRKRDENEDGGQFPERRGRFAGRGETKRERFSESHGHGRVTFPVRGHGRGTGGNTTSYRGRGRGERGARDGRDFKDNKPTRAREPRPSPPVKTIKGDPKEKEEDKENVVVKENANIVPNENSKNVHDNSITVQHEKVLESSSSLAEKDVKEPLKREEKPLTEEKKKDQEVSLVHGSKVGEDKDLSSRVPDKDVEKSKGEDDARKKTESYRVASDMKPKGRGGFGRPAQYSQDSRSSGNQDKRPGGRKFTDKRRTTQESDRDRGWDYDEKRPARNYSRDQTNQRYTGRERGREKEQKSHQFQHYDRDSGNRRSFQDDRKKRNSEKDNDQQSSRQRGDERNQRGGYRPTRGRFAKPPGRVMRGGRSNQPVGSGRFGNNYRRSKSTDEELSDDDYDSDSSSYTTATSASEERRDEKSSDAEKENDAKRGKESGTTVDKSRPSLRSTKSPIRGKVSTRAGGRGAGGFGRSRREVERPPRFQKQQERERANMGRGLSRGLRPGEGRESGPGRGRGRGRGRREQLSRESPDGPGIPVTEDWDQEVDDTQKESVSLRSDKPGGRRESAPRRGFPASRPSADRTRKDKNREPGGTRNTSSRREPFLVEKQQAKVEGSKAASGEPRAPLPAARNGFSKDGNRRMDMQGHVYSTGLDSINTGVAENKLPRKQEAPVRKTDIQQFDLHNIAGVICIDDMTDDDSDISSTLSGFVEVTSRRTQKENKDRQREKEERKKKIDEQNRQRGNQIGNKKNQSSKPPRFSKQHIPQANTQGKSPGVIGKVTSTAVSEAGIGPTVTGSNSNPSSANSTKRNSPVTVERPVSPPPPPVFNAWDKPLIVTPAKPPSVTPVVTSSIPDPLAVGSGKPSSSRPVQPGTVISSAPSLIEDISVDDDYLAMTKEIALLAPPEEPEENEEPVQIVPKTKPKVESRDETSEKGRKTTDPSERRTQPKSQREKPPRFDRNGKRKVASSSDEPKKEQFGGSRARKSSRDNMVSQKPSKGSGDTTVKGKTVISSSNKQQSASTEAEIPDDIEVSKKVQESKEYETTAVGDIVATASDEGSEEKDDVKESEEQDVKEDSESESSRKDSEPDLNVDSAERSDDTDNLFTAGTLSVDIRERPTADRPDREPSPVSPAIFEMTKKMEASRKLWEGGLPIGCTSNRVAAWEETLRTSASVSSSIVGMPVVESTESRLSDDQVAVSKSQSELESNTVKVDSKPDGINFPKKTGSGEQQNVCKVKPQQQQQQTVKPQQPSSIVPQPTEENRQIELNTVPLNQPLLAQDHLLHHQAIQQRYAFPFVNQLVDLQQRQPYLQQQQLQQLQQTNQQVTPTFPLSHVQQVNQARSSSSPLSQTTQDMYQSSFLAGGVYSAGNFQGSQPFVSIALLPSTTTQSLVTSAPRSQTTSLMGIQGQQPKTASGSVFPQTVNPQGTQAMYMQFDPKTLRGFNLTQHPQSTQRHLLGAQSGIVGENVPRQGGFPTAQPAHQPFQGSYPFQQKQSTYDVSQEMKKNSEQTADFTRQSELVKHVNAKPFEPPKRLTPGSVPSSNAAIGPMVSSAFARNPNLMTIRPSAPELGGSSQSPPVSTSLISGRPVSMSPVDPGVPFPAAVGTFPKHAALGQFQVQQQPQGLQPQQFTPFQQQPVGIQHTLQIRAPGQQQQQGVNQLPGAAATILSNPAVMAATMPRQLIRAPGLGPIGVGGTQASATSAQRFPAPIQRPMTSLLHGVAQMQAPRGPHGQTAPPPQMVPTKQQVVSNRPPMPPQSLPHQDPMAAAFKIEQHHKMLEQTRMFFAQQGPQHQQRVLPMNIQADQHGKVVIGTQEDKATLKGQVPRENQKPQEKKEETRNIEANPRNRKTSSEQPNKTSKTTKLDSKPEESSKDKNIAIKQDSKGAANKSGSLVRIPPLPIPAKNRPNRPRGPPRMPGSVPTNKPKISGRPEKEAKNIVPDQPGESPSPKSSDQAKTSNAQAVSPLNVNKS